MASTMGVRHASPRKSSQRLLFGIGIILATLLPLAALRTKIFAEQPDPYWLKKAQQAGFTPFQKKAYMQIALLRNSLPTRQGANGGLDMWSLQLGTEAPVKTLSAMGFHVLPILVDALNDSTSTHILTQGMSPGKSKTWKVNELIAFLIVYLAQRDFVIGTFPNERTLRSNNEPDPNLIPQFKILVSDWYHKNRTKSLEQRKIADVSDPWFRNRLDAVEWLGQQKSRKAVAVLSAYLNKTLILSTRQKNSLTDTEMAETTLALGQIGDKSSLPTVRRVCQDLANRVENNPIAHSMQLVTLFQAYQGRALLGEKPQALHALTTLYQHSFKQWRPSDIKEYRERLQAAKKW